MTRLSSDYLFHFKKSVRILCEILRSGFRHNLWSETLPYRDVKQQNFIVSFCDILPAQATPHSECYGKNALALTKDWGIGQNISPVRYVHESSVGVSQKYQSLKVLFRSAGFLGGDNHEDMLRHYLSSARLYAEGFVEDGNIALAIESDPSIAAKFMKEEYALAKTMDALPEGPIQSAVFTYLNDLFNRIKELHNELQARDAFVRAYVEDFKPADGDVIKNKTLYDEREWRSVKIFAAKEDGSHVGPYHEARLNKFLPLPYNLRFSADDLKYVVVEHESDKAIVQEFVAANVCLISAGELASKLVTFSELSRQA